MSSYIQRNKTHRSPHPSNKRVVKRSPQRQRRRVCKDDVDDVNKFLNNYYESVPGVSAEVLAKLSTCEQKTKKVEEELMTRVTAVEKLEKQLVINEHTISELRATQHSNDIKSDEQIKLINGILKKLEAENKRLLEVLDKEKDKMAKTLVALGVSTTTITQLENDKEVLQERINAELKTAEGLRQHIESMKTSLSGDKQKLTGELEGVNTELEKTSRKLGQVEKELSYSIDELNKTKVALKTCDDNLKIKISEIDDMKVGLKSVGQDLTKTSGLLTAAQTELSAKIIEMNKSNEILSAKDKELITRQKVLDETTSVLTSIKDNYSKTQTDLANKVLQLADQVHINNSKTKELEATTVKLSKIIDTIRTLAGELSVGINGIDEIELLKLIQVKFEDKIDELASVKGALTKCNEYLEDCNTKLVSCLVSVENEKNERELDRKASNNALIDLGKLRDYDKKTCDKEKQQKDNALVKCNEEIFTRNTLEGSEFDNWMESLGKRLNLTPDTSPTYTDVIKKAVEELQRYKEEQTRLTIELTKCREEMEAVKSKYKKTNDAWTKCFTESKETHALYTTYLNDKKKEIETLSVGPKNITNLNNHLVKYGKSIRPDDLYPVHEKTIDIKIRDANYYMLYLEKEVESLENILKETKTDKKRDIVAEYKHTLKTKFANCVKGSTKKEDVQRCIKELELEI